MPAGTHDPLARGDDGRGTSATTPAVDHAFVGTGDFDGDGYLDVILRNLSTGDLHYYYMGRTSLKSWAFWGRTARN